MHTFLSHVTKTVYYILSILILSMQPVHAVAQEPHAYGHNEPTLKDQSSSTEDPQSLDENDDDTRKEESWIRKHRIKLAGTAVLAGILYYCQRGTKKVYTYKERTTDDILHDIEVLQYQSEEDLEPPHHDTEVKVDANNGHEVKHNSSSLSPTPASHDQTPPALPESKASKDENLREEDAEQANQSQISVSSTANNTKDEKKLMTLAQTFDLAGATIKLLAKHNYEPNFFNRTTFAFRVIKDLVCDSEMQLERKQLVMQTLLDNDLATLGIEIKDKNDPGGKRLHIDDVDGDGNTVFTALCCDSKTHEDAILFILPLFPNSFIGNCNGVSAASMLLRNKTLSNIKQLKEYVDIDCKRRLPGFFEEYIPGPSAVCNLIHEYDEGYSDPTAINPAVLYYAQVLDEAKYRPTIAKNINTLQDAYGNTVLHLIAHNIMDDRKKRNLVYLRDTYWDTKQTEENKKLKADISLQRNRDLYVLAHGPLTRDNCMQDPLNLALFDIITTYKTLNPWIKNKDGKYAWDYLDKPDKTCGITFARHLIANKMMTHFIDEKKSTLEDENQSRTQWDLFNYASSLHQKAGEYLDTGYQQFYKQRILAYTDRVARNDYKEYSSNMTYCILSNSLCIYSKHIWKCMKNEKKLIEAIIRQNPIDVNVQDPKSGNTLMHRLVWRVDREQKNTISILKTFINKFRPNLRIKNNDGKTVIEYWQDYLDERKSAPIVYPGDFARQDDKQDLKGKINLLENCIDMFKDVVKTHRRNSCSSLPQLATKPLAQRRLQRSRSESDLVGYAGAPLSSS